MAKELVDRCQKVVHGSMDGVKSTLLNDTVVELSTAKEYDFFDSVLCLGDRIAECPRSVASWQDKIDWFTQSPEYRELDSFDAEPVVFEWTFFPMTHHTEVTSRSPKYDRGKSYSARRINSNP